MEVAVSVFNRNNQTVSLLTDKHEIRSDKREVIPGSGP